MKGAVSGLRAMPGLLGNRVELAWTNPRSDAFGPGRRLAGIRIMRREWSYPLGPTDGTLVYPPPTVPSPVGPVITSFSDGGLGALATYYYSVFAAWSDDPLPAVPVYQYIEERAIGFASRDYGLAERLYRLLPAAYQRLDAPLGAADVARLRIANPDAATALDALPPAIRAGGQLRRFISAAAAPLDVMRSLADALPQLRDVDSVRADYLPALADWMGWQLDRTLPVYAQRNDVRFAPRRYRTVGTIPGVRSLVTRYARWHAQVAEFADQLARSNVVPQLNTFWITASGAGGWRGADDAAATLGFAGANSSKVGSGTSAATLTGNVLFALRAGMEIAITADDRVPAIVRFEADDFGGNPAAATATSLAAVLNRTLTEVTASVNSAGALVIRSNTVGPESALRVEQYEASLVSLEGAPRGRLVPVADRFNPGLGERVRLFYETADPLAPATAAAATQAFSGPPFPRRPLPAEHVEPSGPVVSAQLPSEPQGRVRYKSFRGSGWSTSYPLLEPGAPPHGEPAAVRDTTRDELVVAWVEHPHTPASRLRFRVGASTLARPARIAGHRTGSFYMRAGTRLVVRGSRPVLSGMEFRVTDFAAVPNADGLQLATSAELLTALLRLPGVTASLPVGGTISLESTAAGGDEWLAVDQRHSTAAIALGLDGVGVAVGDWGDEVSWGATADVPVAAPGPYLEPSAVFVAGSGGASDALWLFWSRHDGAQWLVEGARATRAGAAWSWSAVEQVARGVGGDREPHAVLGSTGTVWVVWSRRDLTTRTAEEDCWTLWARERTAGGWNAEGRVTQLGAGQRAADREPSVVAGINSMRVFFRSSRGGGANIHEVTVPLPLPAPAALPVPALVTSGPTSDRWPAPMPVAATGDPTRLLLRSDRSVPLSRVAVNSPPAVDTRVTTPHLEPALPRGRRSFALQDTGTARRHAGTTSVDLGDAARVARRREWDDLLSYTVERPDRWQQPEPSLSGAPSDPDFKQPDDIWYTRGTIGLFLSPFAPTDPLADEQLRERLRPLLDRFLPINERAVVRLGPRIFTEFVYPPDIVETTSFTAASPVIETYPGPVEEMTLPIPWAQLRAVSLAGEDPIPLDVAADPADLATLRRRTFLLPQPEGMMPKTEYPTTELHGMYRDVVTNGGVVVSDSGWKKNLILNGFRTLIASFAHGKSAAPPLSDALGIQAVRFGIGLPAWDAALPPADPTRTALTDPNPFAVPRLLPPLTPGTPNPNFSVTFIQGNVVSATETNVVEITATLPPGVPGWPDGTHATSTLREFGLVGRLDGADVLLNHVAHTGIAKDPGTTLTRTIRLVF
jgi:phage tail-like protein